MKNLPKYQRGAALIMGLLVLALMTGMGLAAARQAQMQEKSGFINKDQQSAFQAAEAALIEGERLLASTSNTDVIEYKTAIRDGTADRDSCHSGHLYLCYKDKELNFSDPATWSNNGQLISTSFATYGASKTSDLAAAPRFIIQHAYTFQGGQAFYVTGRGQGKQGDTLIYVQSTYVVPNP